ncbi:hypothetical protein Ctob_009362 [Chrysochromulina tobinii]|uniref:Uncharacterized protein n=1 Tax=Chrysochromulina tobinii TaxID=1460289 RepID=A0A0M0JIU3_9EUKA|nr:hypothetical protein Ctob_009362 [Chrysochromulina tobinii]|eukprot:KOO26415.1 hypothetical protein Ctob_009362 [Chrysochromulina sp. CCMP291]
MSPNTSPEVYGEGEVMLLLAELGVLASLCTAQVGSVVQQTMEVARRARKEREQLGRAANQFIFRDYMHVDEPKGLIKGLLG